MLDALGEKLALVVLKGEVKSKNLGYGNPAVKKIIRSIAAAHGFIHEKPKAHIWKNLRLVLGTQDIIGLAKDDFGSIDTVLYHPRAQANRKAPIGRVIGQDTGDTAIEPGKTRRPGLIIDQLAPGHQGDPRHLVSQESAPYGLRTRVTGDANPLGSIGSTKGYVVPKSEIVIFYCRRVDYTDVFPVLGKKGKLLGF